MEKYNITRPHKYTKDGEEKTAWKNVGVVTLFEKDGKKSGICELNMFGEEFKVFPLERNADSAAPAPAAPKYPEEDVNPEDMPF